MFWFLALVVLAAGGFIWWKVGWKEGLAAIVALGTGAWAVFSDFFHTLIQ